MAKTPEHGVHETFNREIPSRRIEQQLQALSFIPYLDYGTVVHCVPLHRVYHVQPYRGGPVRVCKLLTRGPTGLLGPYDADTIPPLTPVWFINVPDTQYGYIIGCEPLYSTSGNQYYGEAIVRDDRIGMDEEREYQLPYYVGGQIPVFSGRTPVDSVEAGEFCRVAETGTMLFLDSFLAMIKAGDTCGVMAHLPNRLLRLMGRHLQKWSAISAEEHYVSPQGVAVLIQGVASNILEGLGVVRGSTNFDPQSPIDPQQIRPTGQPAYRDFTLSGGIVDGEAKFIWQPKENVSAANYGALYGHPLSLVYRSYTGHLIQASCSGIHFVKTNKFFGVMPVYPLTSDPTTKHPRDTYGPTNILSTGDEKKDADVKPINILDQHYLLLRDYLTRGSKDVPAFRSAEGPAGASSSRLNEIKADKTLARPMASYNKYKDGSGRQIQVSDTIGYIGILDDGSVCLSDGWGAEIRLSRGCVYITAPLDIYLDSGRNLVHFAGRDAVLKAYKDLDLSTSSGDMRLKAERNLHMLGANAGGDYGVLIESKSTVGTSYQEGLGTAARYPGVNIVANTSNIILKAEQIASYASNSIIDAAPSGLIVRSGDKIVDHTSCVIAHVFEYDQNHRSYKEIEKCEELDSAGPYYAGPRYNLFTYQSSVFDGEVLVKGDVAIYNDVVVGGHTYVAGDVLIDSQFARNTRSSLKATGLSLGQSVITAVDSSWLKGQLPVYAANLFFTCRVDSDYQNEDFTYPEGRWTVDYGVEWDEPPVEVTFVDTNCRQNGQSGSQGSQSKKDPQKTWPFPGARYYDKKAPKAVIRSSPSVDGTVTNDPYKPNIQQVTMGQKHRFG